MATRCPPIKLGGEKKKKKRKEAKEDSPPGELGKEDASAVR